jgi:hypothetical protein
MILQATETELSTILGALRLLQGMSGAILPPAVFSILTDGGRVQPLDDDEIDSLCERMNMDNMPGFPAGELTKLVGALHVAGIDKLGNYWADEVVADEVVEAISKHFDALVAAAAQPVDNHPPTVVLGMEGGLIQWSTADQPVNLIVVDLEEQDAWSQPDAPDVHVVPFLDGERIVYDARVAGKHQPNIAPQFVHMFRAALDFSGDEPHTGNYAAVVQFRSEAGDLVKHTTRLTALSLDHAAGLARLATLQDRHGEVSRIMDVEVQQAGETL